MRLVPHMVCMIDLSDGSVEIVKQFHWVCALWGPLNFIFRSKKIDI